jgi:hypothetical protein
VIFWAFVTALIFVRKKPIFLVGIVLITTILLEFSQLSDHAFLEEIRSFYLGRALIGSSFNWTDIFFYFLGAIFAVFYLRKIDKNYLQIAQF